MRLMDCEKEALVNGQIVINSSVDSMGFLSTNTKNMLKKHGIRNLAEYFDKTSDYSPLRWQYFKHVKKERFGNAKLYELIHIENYAVWERVDGEAFIPRKDFWSAFVNTVTYNFGFLWVDSNMRWLTDYEHEGKELDPITGTIKINPALRSAGMQAFHAVDTSLGLDNDMLLLQARNIANTKCETLYTAIRKFFFSPVVQTAFKNHIIQIIKEASYNPFNCHESDNLKNKKTQLGYYNELPRCISYETVREKVIANDFHYPLIDVIWKILKELSDAGMLHEVEDLDFYLSKYSPIFLITERFADRYL